MKFKFIESPKEELKIEHKNLPYLLDDAQMNSVYGGTSCGILNTCGKTGKNSCSPFDCTASRTSCTGTRTWLIDSGSFE